MIFHIKKESRIFLFAAGASLFFAVVFLAATLLKPAFLSSNYYDKSLNQLRERAESVKRQFTLILNDIASRKQHLSQMKFPNTQSEIFALLSDIRGNPDHGGVAFYNSSRNLVLWLGKTIDLEDIFQRESALFMEQNDSFIVRYKSSVYLIQIESAGSAGKIVFFRLLAFLPPIKARYLTDYHFLDRDFVENNSIDYWDFREDVSGLDSLFRKHNDEYIGQPRLQDEIQTLFFPLRCESTRIMATVTLRSPSLPAKLAEQKENFRILFFLFLEITLALLILFLAKSPFTGKRQQIIRRITIVICLLAARLLFFPLSNLNIPQSMDIFSPSAAGFLSLWGLTKSPADIFLSCLLLFLGIAYSAKRIREYCNLHPPKSRMGAATAMSLTASAITLILFLGFRGFLYRLIFHSRFNLIEISFQPSHLLLHLSCILVFLTFFITVYSLFRSAARFMGTLRAASFFGLLLFFPYLILFKSHFSTILLILQGLFLLFLAWDTSLTSLNWKKQRLAGLAIVLLIITYGMQIDFQTRKNEWIMEHSFKTAIQTQKNWGYFLVQQSIPEIEKRRDTIRAGLRQGVMSGLADTIWGETLLSEFNWYSSLELRTPQGDILSRFSLNIPEPYQPDPELAESRDWVVLEQNVFYLNQEKDFIIAYKDWHDGEDYLGRTLLFLVVDVEMMPFLYSPTPYFEIMRDSSMPTLTHFRPGFAVFDFQGKLTFNPNRLSSGLPKNRIDQINENPDGIWLDFSDKKKKYHAHFFSFGSKIYSLFIPRRGLLEFAAEFVKLLTLYISVLAFGAFFFILIMKPHPWKNPFWSFSNRVYIAFVAIALLPLLFFSLSTRNFFNNFFSQKITQETESQANFARRVMEEFILLRQEEQVSLTIPPDEMVLWISSTISRDVNLYLDGKLMSSSRREFFNYGLLPEMIDGEIYYQMQYENNLFYTQTQNIGRYSFHTLTIPYIFQESLLLISLPFPLQQHEIIQATTDLLEFLIFLSFIFVVAVLLFARGIGDMILTPIRQLLTGTREVGLGNLEIALPYSHNDEMKTLINGFNTMVKNLKKHEQETAELGKKVAWAEMARKVAHEIKNPLTPIQLSAEHLLRVYEDKKENFEDVLMESTSYIVKEVENLRRIAQQFLETSKEALLHKDHFDLRGLIEETLEPYQKTLMDRIPISADFGEHDFHFYGDRDKLKIVLRNLLTNAIESIHDRGKISILVKSDSHRISLEISDTGEGMEEEIISKLFEPYFSTKEAGTGLGLPIAKKIIQDHGGDITAASNHPHGMRFLITLPHSAQRSRPT